MISLILALLAGQPSTCAPSVTDAIQAATQRAAVFDMPGALARLNSVASACPDAAVALAYVQGLVAARDAYRFGGSPESLAPVRAAVAALQSRARESSVAEIARVVLLAASAAAQSEREEMALLLEHARHLETMQRSIDSPGAPVVTAHEIAGDLWLQVHRFEEARAAYREAAEIGGGTPRIELGLARIAVRLGDVATACGHYRDLVEDWPASADTPDEIREARTFLARPDCQGASAPQPLK